MINKNVHLINTSIAIGVRGNESYQNVEKWLDYMINRYGLIIVQSAGNDAQNNTDDGILPLGLAYNTITVGAYDDCGTISENDDVLFSYSSYNNLDGCYKPDIIAPANVLWGGTSSAAPVVTGMIAQMLELKSSLKLQPKVVKAIVLASCHRKAKDANTLNYTEYMNQGLTQKQGAGIIDLYNMLSIVGNNQYGMRVANDTDTIINIIEPKYNSNCMNVSIAWLNNKNKCFSNDYNNIVMETDDIANLKLSVYQNGACIGSSDKTNSSTEMVHYNLNRFNSSYEIHVKSNDKSSVGFAYAWSTDNMQYSTPSSEGIYLLKYRDSGKCLNLNSSNAVVQNDFNELANMTWLLKKQESYYLTNVQTDKVLSIGNALDENSFEATVNSSNKAKLKLNALGDLLNMLKLTNSTDYGMNL